MKKLLFILFLLGSFAAIGQDAPKKNKFKKYFKFSTFYGAVNGGNSISDVDVFSVTNGLETSTIETPFDYSITVGIRKIARFGYENRANTFYDGTETSFSDAATLGKVSGLEFLFEADYKRQQGINYVDQHHFLRYVANRWIVKTEYLQDGFADIEYFESSQRYRQKLGKKLSFNIGSVQRIAEPYGYDPLAEWVLSTGDIHYTNLAIEEGYEIDVFNSEYKDPNGNIVATNTTIWEEVIIPTVLSDYVEKKRNALPPQWNHSLVIGFDFYHYTKNFWFHSWANVLPRHYDDGNEYSYHKFNDGQWTDYSGGLIYGWKINKSLGTFIEGKYNKYWNRKWYDFKFGINYIIL
tara:strand:+ start:1289 stop:2341 length:1053 start_codon:yes stop_codon:yes gene_type:complete